MTAPDNLERRFAEAMGQLLGPDFPSRIALAVSGGGDSMAMLALAHNWARVWGVRLHVVTVDHGLRTQSAEEAALVAREVAALGHAHHVLRWHWDGQGNVMDAARRARLELVGAWCAEQGSLGHVLMAHTADDVAETFLMRLSRGSGVDGLSAMQARRHTAHGFEVIRPCLDMRRAELRHYAKTLRMPWVEDPTNDDRRYLRARVRAQLGTLEELGLSLSDLITTAAHMRRAGEALSARARDVAHALMTTHPSGTLIIDRDGFARVERETQLRLLAAAVMWVSGATYRPRLAGLEAVLDAVLAGDTRTLSGAKIDSADAQIFVYRELAAIRAEAQQGDVWDFRWRVSCGRAPILPLNEGIRAFSDWRDLGVPRAALMAMPACFEAERCVATPILCVNPDCHMILDTGFAEFLLSH